MSERKIIDQEIIDVIFSITLSIHENKWFKEKERTRDEVQEWVAKKLASCMDIYTTPCGMSWGILTTKEKFDEYWNEHGKIKD